MFLNFLWPPSLFVFMFTAIAVTAYGTPECPNSLEAEMPEDCPWSTIARKIIQEPTIPVTQHLKVLAPSILNSVRADGQIQVIRESWGRSINYDEIAREVIVHPPLLEALATSFDTKVETRNGRPIVHAGVEHTFGYLFSILKTPFGYKRARWVKGEIEAGFALPKGSLGPTPIRGDLLRNVTYLLGLIAFRHEPAQMKALVSLEPTVVKELTAMKRADLAILRLEEKITDSPVVLRTDFVSFAHPQTNTHLLIYSVFDSKANRSALITGFPIQKSFIENALKAADLGESKAITTRYNAFVEGITGAPHSGTRIITEGGA